MHDSPLAASLSAYRTLRGAGRPLTEAEVAALEARGNWIAPGAVLRAGAGFDPDQIRQCRLSGHLVLDGRVWSSDLEDVDLGAGCRVERCPSLRRVVVGPRATVRESSIDCSTPTSFGVGTVIKAGLETPGRELPVWEGLTLDLAQAALGDAGYPARVEAHAVALRSDRSFVGEGAEVVGCAWVDRVWVGPAARLRGALRLDEVTVLSSDDEPTTVGAGTHLRQCLIQWGVEVDSGAQVTASILLEHSGAGRQALVTESLIGPNTFVGGGEVTASFLGPFVGFHHQSLLIAAWWPEGRGNVGYGANIGSNHTSRSPDQELWAGEGTFFGLATAVKFPANFQDAPYSILASGVVTLPQRLGLPFSLILDEPFDTPETRGLNRVIPGWVLQENVYLLLRNEAKYLQRNQARRHRFDLRIFRPEIVEKLWKARVLLANSEGKPVYTKADQPALGKNYMLEEDRRAALTVYREFLRYGALKLFAEQLLEGIPCDPEWLRGLFRRLNLDYFSTEQNLAAYLAEEQRLWQMSLKAKERDDQRGASIIPDYQRFHTPAEEDGFLAKRRATLEALEEKIRRFSGNPA